MNHATMTQATLSDGTETRALVDKFQTRIGAIREQVRRVIVGQDEVVEHLLLTLLVGGHCLITGMPGTAKTLLVRTMADALGLTFKRVQFTPDLMPTDVTGTDIIDEDITTGRRRWTFVPGPIFTNIMLADEINRTPPKTQAALLEAMQEQQVTVNGVRYALAPPFFVLATQNPIEQEGTYPLPEAQLDRFLFNVVIDYPSAADERRILAQTTSNETPKVEATATGDDVMRARALVRELPAAENVIDYAARLVRATRPAGDADDHAPQAVRQFVKWGAGPRAGQALLLGGKANALLDGRAAVALEDVKRVALPVLRHRMLLNFQAEADGIDADEIVSRLLEAVPAR
jgi:MoxR-like ATPase